MMSLIAVKIVITYKHNCNYINITASVNIYSTSSIIIKIFSQHMQENRHWKRKTIR